MVPLLLVIIRMLFQPGISPCTSPNFIVEVHHQLLAPAGDCEKTLARLPSAVKKLSRFSAKIPGSLMRGGVNSLTDGGSAVAIRTLGTLILRPNPIGGWLTGSRLPSSGTFGSRPNGIIVTSATPT